MVVATVVRLALMRAALSAANLAEKMVHSLAVVTVARWAALTEPQ